TLHATGSQEFGVTWPLLENDGTPLRTTLTAHWATTAYHTNSDEQSFIALDGGAVVADEARRIQSTYGWLRPVRALAAAGINHTFVYPRSQEDPAAETVQQSFRLTPDGFESALGSVHGTLYNGRTAAGGEGASINCDGSGRPAATFEPPCRFILQ